MKKLSLFFSTLLVIHFAYPQNTDGNFRSRLSGFWNDSNSWQIRISNSWYNASTFPCAGDVVSIQNGHTITLDSNSAVGDLHLNTNGVLACGTFALSVNGKIRSYSGTAETTGIDATYTNSVSPLNGNITCGSGGRLKFTGNSRTITSSGEWGNSGLTNSAVVEFALNNGQTGTMNTGFKASSIIISSGILNMNSFRLAPDNGTSGQGDLSILAGATLLSGCSGTSNQVMSRTTSATTGTAGTLTIYGTLKLYGISPHLAFTNVNLGSGSIVEYSGSSQNFLNAIFAGATKVTTYCNINLSGAGTKTLTTGITINGTLSMQGSAALGLGTYSIAYGANGTLEYKGSSAQTTGSNPTAWPAVNGPGNIIINNSNGLTLGVSRTINGCLTLNSGLLTTSSLYLLTLSATASCTGASDSSFVNGPVKKTGNTAFIFPVGKSGCGFQALAISAPSDSTDEFTAEYIRSSPFGFGITRTSGITAIDSCEYWTLTRNIGTSWVDVTLYGNANSGCGSTTGAGFFNGGGASTNTLRVIHWNGSSWENAANGITTCGGNASDITVKAHDVNSFSPFTFGSVGNNPLPVKFICFNVQAVKNNASALLTWTTATELNNDHFDIERSNDGFLFHRIGEVQGSGTTLNNSMYSYIDECNSINASNAFYYRIRQVDFSSAYTFSEIKAVTLSLNSSLILLCAYPNTFENNLTLIYRLELAGMIRFSLINSEGNCVFNSCYPGVKGINFFEMNTSSIAKGIYFIHADFEGMPSNALKVMKP